MKENCLYPKSEKLKLLYYSTLATTVRKIQIAIYNSYNLLPTSEMKQNQIKFCCSQDSMVSFQGEKFLSIYANMFINGITLPCAGIIKFRGNTTD
jgi:hypothetical protein